MIKLSRLTDYAVVVLSHLAVSKTIQTAPGIAAATGVPEPTVAKVLKALACGGLVLSQRGAKGGYRMLLRIDQISVADVIAAIDGPIIIAPCVDGTDLCETSALCPIVGRWDPVNHAVRNTLAAISIADLLAAPNERPMPASLEIQFDAR
jgi:FeS assembly SUF system regulator